MLLKYILVFSKNIKIINILDNPDIFDDNIKL